MEPNHTVDGKESCGGERKYPTSVLPLALIGNASGQIFCVEGDLDPRRFR